MEFTKFYPNCTVSVLTDQFNLVHFEVPIENVLYRSRIKGLYCYFKNLSGVHQCDLHLTGDLSQVPYKHLLNDGVVVNLTISDIGPVRAYFSSECVSSFDSFMDSIYDWILFSFPDATLGFIYMKV